MQREQLRNQLPFKKRTQIRDHMHVCTHAHHVYVIYMDLNKGVNSLSMQPACGQPLPPAASLQTPAFAPGHHPALPTPSWHRGDIAARSGGAPGALGVGWQPPHQIHLVSSGSGARKQQQTLTPPQPTFLCDATGFSCLPPLPSPCRAVVFSAKMAKITENGIYVADPDWPVLTLPSLGREEDQMKWLETPFPSGKRQFCTCELWGGWDA